MDYHHLTAPCGLDCFNCTFFLAPENPDAMAQIEVWSKEYNIPLEIMQCSGCHHHNGQIPVQMYFYGESHRCAAYECLKEQGTSTLRRQ